MNQKQIIQELVKAIEAKEFPSEKVMAAAKKVTSIPPKSQKKAVASKVKTIQHLLTLLSRHHATKASLPALQCVKLDDGKLHVTDFETWTTLTLPDSPKVQAVIPVKSLKSLEKMKLNDLGEWNVESKFKCEINGEMSAYHSGNYNPRPGDKESFYLTETYNTRWEANDSALMTPGYTYHTITQLDTLTITTDSGTKTIKGIETDQFPSVSPSLGDCACVMVTDVKAIERLARVATCSATDESRPVFTAIKVEVDQAGNVTAVAADGCKLLLDKGINFSETCGSEVEFLLPSTPIQNIARTLKSLGEEKAVLRLYNGYIEIITKQAQFIVSLEEGQFPDYSRIIPDKRDNDTVFGVGNAIQAAKEVSEIAKDSANISIWNVEEGWVKASSDEKGEALAQWNVENVSIPQFEEDNLSACVEIGLNWKYVVDVLNVCNGQPVTGRITAPSSPVRFDTQDGITGVVMPMHIAER